MDIFTTFKGRISELIWKTIMKISRKVLQGELLWLVYYSMQEKELHIKRNWTFILKNSFHEVEKDGRVLKDTSFKLIHLYFRNI